MHRLIIIALIWFSINTLAQERDYRGIIIPEGRLKQVSVSPDGKLWIGTALGRLYYADDFTSEWNNYNTNDALGFSSSLANVYKPNLDKISFFDKENAILTGYISTDFDGFKDGLYRTEDGGMTWESIDFGGDMWVYDAFVNSNGQAWIGGSSGHVYYSNDFGKNWEKCPAPTSMSIRPTTIFMVDSLSGFLGTMGHHGESTYNLLYQTNDNWSTANEIETPYNQKIAEAGKIEQVIYWKNHLIVSQSNDYFYRSPSSKEWIKFDQHFNHMTVDRFSNRLYAITDSLRVVEVINVQKYDSVNDYVLKREPINIISINDTIYALDGDNELYQVSNNYAASTLLYSNDVENIPPINPQLFGDVSWGTDGKQILNYDKQEGKWYRAAAVDFYIYDYYLLSENIAILWDGRDSYQFNMKDKSITTYYHAKPLDNFLKGEIISIEINCGSSCGWGGVHGVSFNQIGYAKTDTTFSTKAYTIFSVGELGANRKEKKKKFKFSFSPAELSNVLQNINEKPYYIPVVNDLNISEADKIYDKDNVERLHTETSESEFRKAVSVLDKYSDLPIDEIIYQNESVLWSTCNGWFAVNVSNNMGDTLTFTKQYYADSKAYHFPWIVSQGNMHFTSFNLKFSNLIEGILPDKFRGKFYFDDNIFLIEFSDFLISKE